MLKQSFAMISILALTTLGGCKKQDAETAPAPAADKAAAKPAAAPMPAPAAAPAVAAPAAPAAPAAAATGPAPSADKEMLGLDLAPIGKWKPTWDADAKVAKWENDDFMTGIVIRIVTDKLDNVDDLKAAAPMMMQLGTAITEVVENKTTPKGWYAVVKDNDGKSTELTYVQKYGGTQIVCSSVMNSAMGPGAKKEDILKACDSIKVK